MEEWEAGLNIGVFLPRVLSHRHRHAVARGSTLRDRLTAIRIQASRRAVESELRERSLGLVLLDAQWLSS